MSPLTLPQKPCKSGKSAKTQLWDSVSGTVYHPAALLRAGHFCLSHLIYFLSVSTPFCISNFYSRTLVRNINGSPTVRPREIQPHHQGWHRGWVRPLPIHPRCLPMQEPAHQVGTVKAGLLPTLTACHFEPGRLRVGQPKGGMRMNSPNEWSDQPPRPTWCNESTTSSISSN